jgi:hypothetical protein
MYSAFVQAFAEREIMTVIGRELGRLLQLVRSSLSFYYENTK